MVLASKHLRLTSFAALAIVGILAFVISGFARPLTPTGVVFVDDTASATPHDGSNWAHAFLTLDAAITAASTGNMLWVAEGNYPAPSAGGDGFVITKQLSLYGGFDATESTLDTRVGHFEATTLDGGGANRVMTVSGVSGTPVVIDGFQIKDGVGSGSTFGAGFNGGGIYSGTSDLNIANCLFKHNISGGSGGGLYFAGVSGTPNTLNMKLCEYRDNHAEDYGGAIYGAFLTTGDVVNTLFNSNYTILNDGGAVYLTDMGTSNQLWFTNGIFWRNYVTATGSKGGGMALGQSGTTSATAANAMIVNCTFVGNAAPVGGDGQALHSSANSHCEFYNSIAWFNNDATFPTAVPVVGVLAIDYADIENWTLSGLYPNIINGNPGFRSIGSPSGLTLRGPTSTPFYLGSPCIDHADYNRLPNDNLDVNEDGTTGGKIPWDMGRSGRTFDWIPTTPNLGYPSTLDYMDMGAYEKQ